MRKKEEERSKEKKTILLYVYLSASIINNEPIRRRHIYIQTTDNVDGSPSSSLPTNFTTKRNG